MYSIVEIGGLCEDDAHLLQLVLPSPNEVYLSAALPGGLAKAKELGYELIVGMDELNNPNYLKRLSSLLDRDVDGVLLFPSPDFENSSLHHELLNSHRAAVLMEHNVRAGDLDFVGMDDHAAYRSVLKHLVELGHQRIGFLYEEEQNVPSAHMRRMEFDQAVDEFDLPVLPRYYFSTSASGNDISDERVCQVLQGVGDYTALVVRGRLRAEFFYNAAQQRGIRVPEDLSIVVISGHDYQRDRVQFTSLRTAMQQIGSTAVDLLVQRLSQPNRDIQTVLVPGHFQIGQTSSRPGKKSSQNN